jgi:hypothetical protein
MTAEEIIKYAARNVGILSTDNQITREGLITREGMLDELNRIYLEIVGNYLIDKFRDELNVEARSSLYKGVFTINNIDFLTNILTASQGAFGTADVGYYIYNPLLNQKIKIERYISSTQVVVSAGSDMSWIGIQAYSLTPIVILDGEMSDAKDITKVQIRYQPKGYWQEAKYTTVSNFLDGNDNVILNTTYRPEYCLTSIRIGNKTKRAIRFSPAAINDKGEIKINYTQPLDKLEYTDSPRFEHTGINEVLINGLTAWAFKAEGSFDKAQAFEESNVMMGGIIPRGLTAMNQRLSLQRQRNIRFKSIWKMKR